MLSREGWWRFGRCICKPLWVGLFGVSEVGLVHDSFSFGGLFLCLFFQMSFWLGLAYHLQQFPLPRD